VGIFRLAKIKQFLRNLLGDEIATWIHATRFYFLNKTKQKEIDLCLIPLLVHEGDVVIDIGANGADWTQVLSRQVGKSGKVYAFEADPYYAEVTRKIIVLLGLRNVTFFPFGLSDCRETTLLQILDHSNERLSGMGRIIRDELAQGVEREQCLEIRLETLDHLVKDYPDMRRVRFIKCDVEGFELMVYRGAQELLQATRPVVVSEVGGGYLHGYPDVKVFDFFHQLEYDSYVVVSERPLLRRSNEVGEIPEGPRPNRVMIPHELSLNLEIQ